MNGTVQGVFLEWVREGDVDGGEARFDFGTLYLLFDQEVKEL